MACLYRMISARYRHIKRMNKGLPAKVHRLLDVVSGINICVGGFWLRWLGDNEVRLIPVADKYLLVGDETVVENVKTQICAEYNSASLRNAPYQMSNIDIEIIEEENQYNAIKEGKSNALLLCLSTATDRTNVKYCLPETLPSTIKSKYVFVETKGGERYLNEAVMQYLKNDPTISTHFKDIDVNTICPVIPSKYMNMKISEASKQFIYLMYGICVSLMIKGNFIINISKKK